MKSPNIGGPSAPAAEPETFRPYHAARVKTTAKWLKMRAIYGAYYGEHAELRAAELARCAADPVHWCTYWAWTYDPRNVYIVDPATGKTLPADVPFVPYPKQADYLRWLHERALRHQGGICEKSRDEGVSWLTAGAYLVWALLFIPGFAGGIGSRKASYVDELDNMDALLPKARYQLDHLPGWMRPHYTAPLMRCINHDNGASITGEGGDEIGRGGRKSMYIVDEHAFIEHAEPVEWALSQNTPCVIRVSTPNGEGNEFHRLRFSNRLPVFTLHWSNNPMKGATWYEDECARLVDPVTIARELDISYSASLEGVCIPSIWVRAAVELDLGAFGGPSIAGLDVAAGGAAENVCYVRRGARVTRGEAWRGDDVPGTALRAAAIADEEGARIIIYDAIGVGAGVGGTLSRRTPSFIRGVPFLGGAAPIDMRHDDAPSLRAGERFANLRAQGYWIVRQRFAKTYRHVTGLAKYPLDELISLPNVPALIMQLSQPRIKYTSTGKLLIESKEDMARRGVGSPDHADALVYTFADPLVARDEAPIVITQAVY